MAYVGVEAAEATRRRQARRGGIRAAALGYLKANRCDIGCRVGSMAWGLAIYGTRGLAAQGNGGLGAATDTRRSVESPGRSRREVGDEPDKADPPVNENGRGPGLAGQRGDVRGRCCR